MKSFLLSVALMGLPYYLPGPVAYAGGEDCQQRIMVKVAGPTDDPAAVHKMVLTSMPQVSPGGENQAWLGVLFDSVPESLAAQIGSPGKGVLVLNVAKESPAERAGIEVHDVVVAIGGTELTGEIPQMVEVIRAFKPGDKADLSVLRNGQKVTLHATFGQKPGGAALVWKHEGQPQARVEERIRTRGKIVGKGPEGKWFVKDLGDLEGMKDLPEQLKVLMPKGDNESVEVFVDGNSRVSVRTQVLKDGTSIVVRQEGDGEVTVDRTDADGNTSTKAYADESELEEGDEEAYELFNTGDKQDVLFFHGMGKDGKTFNIQLDALEDGAFDWRTDLEEQLREAREALESARDEMEQNYKGLATRFHAAGRDAKAGALHEHLKALHLGKPSQTFMVQPDGRIEVRIRKGDTEIVRVFENEGDLAKRDPGLFGKYNEVMNPEE